MKLRTKLIIAFVVVMIFPVTFALIAMHAFVPGRGAEIQQLYLIAVVLTTAFLILWIYRSVSVPLEKLQRAARNIKEGILTLRSRQNQMTRLDNFARTLKRCVSD